MSSLRHSGRPVDTPSGGVDALGSRILAAAYLAYVYGSVADRPVVIHVAFVDELIV